YVVCKPRLMSATESGRCLLVAAAMFTPLFLSTVKRHVSRLDTPQSTDEKATSLRASARLVTVTAPPAISTVDLTRSFRGGVALDGLTIDVPAGEVLALLGPNGAGKTTTVRLLNGVLTPDRGSATVLGLDPAVDGDAV